METRGLVDPPPRRGSGRPAIAAIAGRQRQRRSLWTALIWLAVILLLALALRQAPLGQVMDILRRLTLGQVLVLALVNTLILLLMTARWHLALRGLGQRVPLVLLLAYRLAGYSVSYVTPGPQFGGEPVLVHLLHQARGLPLPTAISAVFIDRVIDLLANFTFLVMGVATVALSGLLLNWVGAGMWFGVLALVAIPLAHLLALGRGKRPASALLLALQRRFHRPELGAAVAVTAQAEEQVAFFLRDQPGVLASMVGISVLIWSGLIFEFWLCLVFLGVQAGPADTVSALTAARLAILMPLPGGLGALEAGQAFATRLLGWGPAVGIAVSVVIRARDILLALLGFALGSAAYRSILLGSRVSERS